MSPPKTVRVGTLNIGGGNPIVLIAGPCVVENRDLILLTAARVSEIAKKHRIPCIFKSSYRKANRMSGQSFSTIGMEEALSVLAEVKEKFRLPILTDIHSVEEARIAAEVADVIQVPAFLSRQTEILEAAGKTGKAVNIKKGQFLTPGDMKYQAAKVAATGNRNILLTERGTTFGYHNLVVDMRSLAIMRSIGYPVVLDATHSIQLPGADSGHAGGEPEFIFPIARAGVAVGVDALFVEVHPNPRKALSDAASQLPLGLLEDLVVQVKAIDRTVRRVVGAHY